MKSHEVVSWDMWATSPEGQECQRGAAEGKYLKNRLNNAFMAGYEARQQVFSAPKGVGEHVSVIQNADMWRSGGFVYMQLAGNEYMFNIGDINGLPDLSGSHQ